MAAPTIKKLATSINTKSISINNETPITALPVGGGTTCGLDAFTTPVNLTFPEKAKWALFSSTVDFAVAFQGPGLSASGLPGTIDGPGSAGYPDPDTSGEVATIEINPGLRDITGYETCEIKGFDIGMMSVLYYE